ncbi:MAG: hypothetical protein QOD53_1874 [Thermoleophilaceae bacterium]|nr:hypothetical protein [Thermoleophilaceae bacterium]
MTTCTHLDQVQFVEPPDDIAGCAQCLATGDVWVHLRMCMTCGEIACCDDSPNRHATAHHKATGHPIIRSAQPGEEWSWCYDDQLMFVVRAG